MLNHTLPVFITGMGIVSSFGSGISVFLNALSNADCRIQKSLNFPELNESLLLSEIAAMDFTSVFAQCGISKNKVVRNSAAQQAALLSAIEAYLHAGLDKASVHSERVGIVVAGGNLSQLSQWRQFQKHNHSLSFVTPSWASQFLDSYLLSSISDVLAINGPGITVSAASASSHAGLMQGLQWIKLGIVDACLVVGPLAELSAIEWQALINAGAIGGRSFQKFPEQACRPFDRNHEGFIAGQAAACVVLESETSTTWRGITPFSELLSVAMNLGANRSMEPSVGDEIRVMKQALHQAQIEPEDIDYINAHGTSTPLGDITELEAIDNVFSEKSRPFVNSTKSITGHCLWSAGIVELIAVVLQMQNNFVHANRNLDDPIDHHCQLVGKQKQHVNLNYALSNSFGFGGINSSLVVRNSP
jgi:malonyl-ACP decarboxylase